VVEVVTLSLTHADQGLVVDRAGRARGLAAVAAEHGVTAASGTPTFWRQAIYRDADALGAVPLEQITLGGEPVDQAILDQLREIFPKARISWIYASSEVGASIVVHDGKAGFPRPGSIASPTRIARSSRSRVTSWSSARASRCRPGRRRPHRRPGRVRR
jgi:acyl-CoA synthetase (AMP-forming)/AMP-acid ligase II